MSDSLRKKKKGEKEEKGRRKSTPKLPLLPLLSLLLITLSSCSLTTPAQPPVPDSLMVEVLLDLHLAAARAEIYTDVSSTLRDSILTEHGLDTTRFQDVMQYYFDQPEAYAPLLKQVLDRLNEQRQLQAR